MRRRGGPAQVYVYRTSVAATEYDYGEKISFDGRELGVLRSPGLIPGCPYFVPKVDPGVHWIIARSKSYWFNFGTIGEKCAYVDLDLDPGKVYFAGPRPASSRRRDSRATGPGTPRAGRPAR